MVQFSNLASFCLLSSSFLTVASAARSAGCGKTLLAKDKAGNSHNRDFRTSDDTDRTYIIHIPTNYDKNTPVPLIFSFHGHGKTAAGQEKLSQFSNEGSGYNPNGIAIYPQGTENDDGTVNHHTRQNQPNHTLTHADAMARRSRCRRRE